MAKKVEKSEVELVEFPGNTGLPVDMFVKILIWTEKVSYKEIKRYEEQMKNYVKEREEMEESNASLGANIFGVEELKEPNQPKSVSGYEPAYMNLYAKIIQLWMPTKDEDLNCETITVDMFDIHTGNQERYLIKMEHQKWINLIKTFGEIDETYI